MKSQIREVKVIDLITHSILSPILLAIVVVCGCKLFTADGLKWVIFLLAIAGYFFLRRSVIGAVLLYKVLAPAHVRERCRFQPTCSTYMILAINKYGLIIGIIKGIKRLLRCKPPNGGEDYP